MGSVALHAAVAAALLISWRHPRDLKIGSVVPVTIVSDGPPAEFTPATQAPETQTAQSEAPTPAAPPEPVPPPQPVPQPPTPVSKPAAQPMPTPAKTPPPKPAPAKPEKSLDLDALAASVSKMARPVSLKASSAAKGPVRVETAPQAGKALSRSGQAALNGLVQDLERRWNPNCGTAGVRDVQVRITFKIGAYGEVPGDLAQVMKSAPHTVSGAATIRAAQTVLAAAPFKNLPSELYGQTITAIFNGKDACL
jgi:outer membrane biosynthesis protein TonB